MEIHQERQSGILILRPEGRLDGVESPQLETVLLGALEQGEANLVVDLSAVPYISSRGLRVFLLGAKKAAEHGGRIGVCALQDFVRQMFEAAGFEEVLGIFASPADAVAAVGGAPDC